jgi:hypothetical protein
MRIHLTHPTARMVDYQFIQNTAEWLADTGKHEVVQSWAGMAGRIDAARSMGFFKARAGNFDMEWQLDTDCKMLTPFHDVVSFLNQDFSGRHFDIIAGPTISVYGGIMAWPNDKTIKPTSTSVIEGAAAFGFVAFSPNIIQNMKHVTVMNLVNEDQVPLYCDYANNSTEDVNWCKYAVQQGFKVGFDCRIKVQHLKMQGFAPVYPDELEKQRVHLPPAEPMKGAYVRVVRSDP